MNYYISLSYYYNFYSSIDSDNFNNKNNYNDNNNINNNSIKTKVKHVLHKGQG